MSVLDWQHSISGVSWRSLRTLTEVPPSTSMRTRRSLHDELAWNRASEPLLFMAVEWRERIRIGMLQIQTVDRNKNLSFTDIGICGKKISHKPFSIAFVLRLKKNRNFKMFSSHDCQKLHCVDASCTQTCRGFKAHDLITCESKIQVVVFLGN